MAAKKNSTPKEIRSQIITAYMEYVLTEGQPKSVFSFCKHHKLEESEFYDQFGSIESLRKTIWADFYLHVESLLLQNEEYPSYSSREKLLTFYYTFFEMLTANRSYVLFALSEEEQTLKNLKQLSKLRDKIKDFGKELVESDNDSKNLKIVKKPVAIVSEAVWVQFLFLLKFWKEDESPAFEKTDVAIEKSVNTVFDVFDNTPLENIIDLGKFLWKEKSKA